MRWFFTAQSKTMLKLEVKKNKFTRTIHVGVKSVFTAQPEMLHMWINVTVNCFLREPEPQLWLCCHGYNSYAAYSQISPGRQTIGEHIN